MWVCLKRNQCMPKKTIGKRKAAKKILFLFMILRGQKYSSIDIIFVRIIYIYIYREREREREKERESFNLWSPLLIRSLIQPSKTLLIERIENHKDKIYFDP